MTCQTIGRPAISISGFGRSPFRRVPRPPQRIITSTARILAAVEAKALAYETPRPEIARHVPASARRVLDLGCAAGGLATLLKQRGGVEVVGVERDEAYAAAAATRCDRVVHADVETLDPGALGRFDCLVAADVLEHLVDPWTALRTYAHLLE